MNGLIELAAAGIDQHLFKAVLHQNPGGVVGPHADGAEHHDGFALIQLAQPLPYLPQRDVHRARHREGQQLRGLADIQKDGVPAGLHVPGGEADETPQQVVGGEAQHIHGVLGGGVGRRVGQLQILEIVNAAAQPQRHAQGVDALIRAVPAHGLRAIELLAVHDGQKLVDIGGLVDKISLVQQGADVQIPAGVEIGLDVGADLQNADDVVDAALVHGQAAVPLLLDERQDVRVGHGARANARV